MPIKVYIPTPYRELTAGRGHVDAHGETIAGLIEDLERCYPGLRARICDGAAVRHHVNVFVNGQEMRSLRGESTPLSEGDEVAFIPALAGGSPQNIVRKDVIEITRGHHDDIVAHARNDFPNECCGLLFGEGSRADRLLRMENVEHSPLNYRVDSQKLLEAFQMMEEVGLDLVGIYHSHTHSPAAPSRTDIALAGYPDVHYLIVSLADPDQPVLRAFLIDKGLVEEQAIQITPALASADTRPGGREL
ncbi:MAG TPA: Mov34/MPN/PAD-1 family protein [Chloroflexota bacterium]|nr:Mov34/MPN/PAD-1 family protein [Chloroflexota bacterium]